MYGKMFSRIWFRIEARRRDLWLYAIKQLNKIIDTIDGKLRDDLNRLADDYNVVLLLGIEKYRDDIMDMRPMFYVLAKVEDKNILKYFIEDLKKLLGDGWDNGRFGCRVVKLPPAYYKYKYGSKADEVLRELKKVM